MTDRTAEYSVGIEKELKKQGFRAVSDLRNEKLGFKIRQHTLERTPFLLVVGDREVENGQVAVRTREGEDLGAMTIDAFVAHLQSA